jgi:hypothetical protein
MVSTSKLVMILFLVLFVLWLGLLAGFFYENTTDGGAGDGWNWALGIVTTVGAVAFLIFGSIAISTSNN